jgi:hypothetical protein
MLSGERHPPSPSVIVPADKGDPTPDPCLLGSIGVAAMRFQLAINAPRERGKGSCCSSAQQTSACQRSAERHQARGCRLQQARRKQGSPYLLLTRVSFSVVHMSCHAQSFCASGMIPYFSLKNVLIGPAREKVASLRLQAGALVAHLASSCRGGGFLTLVPRKHVHNVCLCDYLSGGRRLEATAWLLKLPTHRLRGGRSSSGCELAMLLGRSNASHLSRCAGLRSSGISSGD